VKDPEFGVAATIASFYGPAIVGAISKGLGALRAAAAAGETIGGLGAAERAVGATESAYSVASKGGRHAGFLRQAEQWSTAQLQRAERSFQRMIEMHEAKIADPASHVSDWTTQSTRYQEGLVRHWGQEITSFSEQQSITQEIISRRGR
jgi:hypothetical protein